MTTEIRRGRLGTMPRATERDDESYLDFVESARAFGTHLDPQLRPRVQQAFAEFERRTNRRVETLEDAKEALDMVAIVATRNRIMRSTQEMMWQGVIDTYRKREAEFLRELDESDKLGPGSVEVDPNFVYPEYFAKVDFHIQPGGYYADPLAGYIYHYGTKLFFNNANNYDDVQRKLVNFVPTPRDGKIERVLDMACSIGQSATALKERWLQAEVWGIDIAAPMVRYAHKRAREMGLTIHFRQRAAEDTKFPDNYFDVVYSYILFHEIPATIAEKVVQEAKRILRPGGLFVITDFGTAGPKMDPSMQYFFEFSRLWNGEPYAADFVRSDFRGMLDRAGFSRVEETRTGDSFIPMRVCEK